MTRPCHCNNFEKGEPYQAGMCKLCWDYHQNMAKHREWGGSGQWVGRTIVEGGMLPPKRERGRAIQLKGRPLDRGQNTPSKPRETFAEPFPSRRGEEPSHGPGTELKAFFKELGVEVSSSCSCNKFARQMNAWGVAGCREHRAEIVKWLGEQQKTRTWGQAISTALTAVAHSMASNQWLNPLDHTGSLVDEAIRRAEVKEQVITKEKEVAMDGKETIK